MPSSPFAIPSRKSLLKSIIAFICFVLRRGDSTPSVVVFLPRCVSKAFMASAKLPFMNGAIMLSPKSSSSPWASAAIFSNNEPSLGPKLVIIPPLNNPLLASMLAIPSVLLSLARSIGLAALPSIEPRAPSRCVRRAKLVPIRLAMSARPTIASSIVLYIKPKD